MTLRSFFRSFFCKWLEQFYGNKLINQYLWMIERGKSKAKFRSIDCLWAKTVLLQAFLLLYDYRISSSLFALSAMKWNKQRFLQFIWPNREFDFYCPIFIQLESTLISSKFDKWEFIDFVFCLFLAREIEISFCVSRDIAIDRRCFTTHVWSNRK